MRRMLPRSNAPATRPAAWRIHVFAEFLLYDEGKRKMAEEEGFTGVGEQLANGSDGTAQIGMISQYVKDLSFENPNSPAVYQWQVQPQIEVQFNIGTNKLGDDIYEVALKIEVLARAEQNTAFAVDLLYAGLFAIQNLPDEQLQPFLFAEAPRLLFPFARRIVSDAIRDGGFPPLLLDPIDFGQLYMQQAAQRQAEATGAQASLETGDA
jgi:preprotein translocase subunit SecB